MKSQLASFEVACIVKELQELIGGKIDKIFQPLKNELIIQLHIPNIGKKYLKIVSGRFMYLSSIKQSTVKPPGFCMYLRKIIGQARVRGIKQYEFERIVELELETKEDKFSLIFELFGTGNILLLKDNVILSAIEYKKWKDRDIMPKQEYNYPKMKYNFLKITESELIKLLEETSKESLVKALALELGLGGVYAEELCLRAKLNKDSLPNKFKKISELFNEIKKLRKLSLKPMVVDNGKDITPVDLMYYKLDKKPFSSFNEALDSILSEKITKDIKTKLETTKNKDIVKVEAIINAQTKVIKKLTKNEELNKQKAELIYSNYNLLENIIKEMKKAMSKFTEKEIKSKLKGHKIVKSFDFKEKAIEIEFE